MPEYDKNRYISRIDYVAVEGNDLFRMRDCINYSKVTLSGNQLPHLAAPRLDGQALAGTGALVFEGEVLVVN